MDLSGINIISEMTKDDLIEEFIEYQRKELEALDLKDLKAHIISIRVGKYKERLEREAGINMQAGIFGIQVTDAENPE